MFNPFEILTSILKLRRDLRIEKSYQGDAFRLEAQRVIDAFKAHDLAPNEVMRLLPPEMSLGESVSVLGDALELRKHLAVVSPWATTTLALDPSWVRGKGEQPHTRIHSYKHFSELVRFFESREGGEKDDSGGLIDRCVLHVFKQDGLPISESKGPFVVILQEEFATLDGESFHRFYYLTEGHHFEHSPCSIHLLQILTLALRYRLFICGRVMKVRNLRALDEGRRFVPDLWREEFGNPWYPDDVFYKPNHGRRKWNLAARGWLEESLRGSSAERLLAGLPAVEEEGGVDRL